MAPKPAHCPPRAIGYVRVSTNEQADSGNGLEAQRAAIQREANHRGWELQFIEDAGISGKSLDRPGIQRALAALERGDADILCVSKLDRISRSVRDAAELLERAESERWSLVALDIGLDMSTPAGEFAYNVIISAAQYERRLIKQRTKDAMAEAKRKGPREGKKPIGRPQVLPDATVRRILDERSSGLSMGAIAAGLERDGVPTARDGSHWHASTVRAVLLSQKAAELR
jgi:DNA invertase Pin-like site-specific DNA recombinase